MRKSVFPLWMFVVVAFVIALVAFLVGQIAEGAGVFVVLLGTTGWVAFVAQKGAKGRSNG